MDGESGTSLAAGKIAVDQEARPCRNFRGNFPALRMDGIFALGPMDWTT